MNHEAASPADDVTHSPPYAVSSEKSVLSCIIQEPAEFMGLTIESGITPEHFHLPAHRLIFETLAGIYAENGPAEFDIRELVQLFLDRGTLDRAGGPATIYELTTYEPAPAQYFARHAEQLRRKFVSRKLIEAGNRQIADAYENPEDPAEALDAAEARIMAIRDHGTRPAEKSTAAIMNDVIDEFRRLVEGKPAQHGISTGLQTVDEITEGMKPGEMIVIAARPSMGKTALAMNIIEAAAVDRGEPALVFSLEMPAVALLRRMTQARARINPETIKGDKGTLQRIQRAALEINRAPLVIDDSPGITIAEIRAKARRMHRSKGIRLIAVDYLQLIRSTSRQAQASREREVSEISQGLKALAKELALPVIVLAQLNREAEKRTGKNVGRPRLSDLRESGSIEQDADIVSLLYRPAYYAECDDDREANAGFAELIIAKNRNGRTGAAALTWIAELTTFESGAPARVPAPMPQTPRSRWTPE